MKTLKEHNKETGSAHVACDECGTGMDYDFNKESMERKNGLSMWPPPQGRPVKCPKCSNTGRKL